MLNSDLVQRFVAVYTYLDKSAMAALTTIYSDEVVFIDPFRRIEGLVQLTNYLQSLSASSSAPRFQCREPALCGDEAYIRWQLFFSHPRLNGGREISVSGVSCIRGTKKLTYHEDFYDGGALLYEHVPLIGAAVRFLKRRM